MKWLAGQISLPVSAKSNKNVSEKERMTASRKGHPYNEKIRMNAGILFHAMPEALYIAQWAAL